jgi:hypothetical protein
MINTLAMRITDTKKKVPGLYSGPDSITRVRQPEYVSKVDRCHHDDDGLTVRTSRLSRPCWPGYDCMSAMTQKAEAPTTLS